MACNCGKTGDARVDQEIMKAKAEALKAKAEALMSKRVVEKEENEVIEAQGVCSESTPCTWTWNETTGIWEKHVFTFNCSNIPECDCVSPQVTPGAGGSIDLHTKCRYDLGILPCDTSICNGVCIWEAEESIIPPYGLQWTWVGSTCTEIPTYPCSCNNYMINDYVIPNAGFILKLDCCGHSVNNPSTPCENTCLWKANFAAGPSQPSTWNKIVDGCPYNESSCICVPPNATILPPWGDPLPEIYVTTDCKASNPNEGTGCAGLKSCHWKIGEDFVWEKLILPPSSTCPKNADIPCLECGCNPPSMQMYAPLPTTLVFKTSCAIKPCTNEFPPE